MYNIKNIGRMAKGKWGTMGLDGIWQIAAFSSTSSVKSRCFFPFSFPFLSHYPLFMY
jgi:hypothetical protein